jgi:hypothetical protein
MKRAGKEKPPKVQREHRSNYEKQGTKYTLKK